MNYKRTTDATVGYLDYVARFDAFTVTDIKISMKFRLTAELPREIDFGAGAYVLELVDSEPGDGCWLRARACEEPAVFLLAHFQDRSDAVTTLLDACEVSECPVHRQLICRLTEQGAAEVVRRSARRFVLPPLRRWEPAEARVLELAET